jgi:hypothetical protein
MGKVIISAGEKLHCHSKEGIIGALIKYNNRKCALTAYHILKAGNCNVGDKINLDEHYGRLEEIRKEADLAIISIDASDDEVKISEIATPEIGSAYSLNGFKRIDCRVMTIGRTYHYLAFPWATSPFQGIVDHPLSRRVRCWEFWPAYFTTMPTVLPFLLIDLK